mmetsp:Transcript_130661/g.279375  ORF Transcript_130661/g.279375 Transcript_130661/m.279375 type:complete len:264 (+) Transcript_130661:77-868(+)
MGCCASVPKAEVFLATAQPPPAEGYLIDGLPSSVKMMGWSFCGDHHSQGAMEDFLDWTTSDDPVARPGRRSLGAGPGGVGSPEELTIVGMDDKPLASLVMPKHLSFGVGANLKDSAGNVVALLRTAERKRAQGMFSSAYNILVQRPQFQGQAPVVQGWYLWASVKRAPFTGTVKILNGQGVELAKGHTYMGYVGGGLGAQRWKCETLAGQGTMLCLPTTEKPKRHHVQCAAGVDVLMQICFMYAAKLANDELYKSPGGDSGGD